MQVEANTPGRKPWGEPISTVVRTAAEVEGKNHKEREHQQGRWHKNFQQGRWSG